MATVSKNKHKKRIPLWNWTWKDIKGYQKNVDKLIQERNVSNMEELMKAMQDSIADRKRKFTTHKKKKDSETISLETWKNHFMQLLDGTDAFDKNKTQAEKMTTCEVKLKNANTYIFKMKKRKAMGVDQIPAEAWYHLPKSGKRRLKLILTELWKNGGIPESWKYNKICTIFKKDYDNKNDPKNYRGIMIADSSYKLWAIVLNEMLQKDLNKYKILNDGQTGFRRKRGPKDNIIVLKHAIEKQINEKDGKAYVLFADIKKAFDNVNRQKLFQLMKSTQIDKVLISRIEELYDETINVIRNEKGEEVKFWSTKGLKQGCPLSPALFNIYISDLEEKLQESNVGGLKINNETRIMSLTYADDLAVLANDKESLKTLLEKFRTYLREKGFELSIEKTKIMEFKKNVGSSTIPNTEKKLFEIDVVKEFMYLGFIFQENNGIENHINYILSTKKKKAIDKVMQYEKRNLKPKMKME